jgi:membrane protein required for colicin V production
MGLTGLDIVVLLVMALAGGLGLMRGFIVEATALAAWLVAIFAVKFLHTPVSAMLLTPVGTPTGAAVLALVLVFGGAFLGVKLVGREMGRAAHSSFLGPFDRILGLGFGALKGLVAATVGFLFVSLLLNMTSRADSPRPDWMIKARTYPLLRASSEALVNFVGERQAKP